MHDSSLGRGSRGVGREAFLAYLQAPVASAISRDGSSREGVIVALLERRRTGDDLAHFIQIAIDFKNAVTNGALNTLEMTKARREFGQYFQEFSGPKKRKAQVEVEYLTRHGDIVEALRVWRPLDDQEAEVKSGLIDRGVRADQKLMGLYEVKTSCARQSLYTGI